jgi:hypothetical protein
MSHSWEHHGNFTEISVVNRGNAMGISWEYNGNVIRIKERLQNRKLRVKPHRKARRYPLRPLFLEPKLESHEEVKTHPLGWLLSVPPSYESDYLHASANAAHTLRMQGKISKGSLLHVGLI